MELSWMADHYVEILRARRMRENLVSFKQGFPLSASLVLKAPQNEFYLVKAGAITNTQYQLILCNFSKPSRLVLEKSFKALGSL